MQKIKHGGRNAQNETSCDTGEWVDLTQPEKTSRPFKPAYRSRRMFHFRSQSVQPRKEHSSSVQGRRRIWSRCRTLIAGLIGDAAPDRLPAAAAGPAGLNVRIDECCFP